MLVISAESLSSQGLKALLERSGTREVITASEKALAAPALAELSPEVLIIDRSNLEDIEPETLFPSTIIVLCPGTDRLAVYNRQEMTKATVDNLLSAIETAQKPGKKRRNVQPYHPENDSKPGGRS